MRLIELKKLQKLRISFEEILELKLLNYKTLKKLIVANSNINILNGNRYFVLELMLPRNCSYYVVLGAKYIPDIKCKGLHVEVRSEEDKVENFKNTILHNKKTVFKGLPTEYVETIFKTTIDYFKINEVPNGRIVFDSSAYCEVGSSPLIFKIATKIIFDVLLSKCYPLSDNDIKNICEKYLLIR